MAEVTPANESGGAVWLTVVAPLELAGARCSGHFVGQNSPAFLPMLPERCGELTWVVLEQRGLAESAGGSEVNSSSLAVDDRGLWRSANDVNWERRCVVRSSSSLRGHRGLKIRQAAAR
jgi:hypothetical protein